jgi:hypothetical protein
MNSFKNFIAVSIPLIAFVLGIYFQAYLPSSTREIASFGTTAARPNHGKMDLKVSNALRECINDQVKDNRLALSKSGVDGRNWSIVSVNCVDDKAKNLYDAIAPYSSEQYVRYNDGRRGVGRFFGRLYPPSQCVRVIAQKGSELNFYSCRIFIDLDSDLIQNLKF